MRLRVTSLPGDGIGPEVTRQAIRVLEEMARSFGHELELTEKEIGGAALTAFGDPLPHTTIEVLSRIAGRSARSSGQPGLRP